MTRKTPEFTLDVSTNEWVHESGRRIPVIRGGDSTADPSTVVIAADPAAPVEQTSAPVDPATPASANSQLFTAEQVEAARKQEKEKLYGRLEGMEKTLSAFNEERDAAAKAAAEATERAEAERKARELEELSAKELILAKEDEFEQRLNTAQSEWEEKFNQMQQESEARQALLDQERRFQELETYKSRRLTEEAENLMPQVIPFIRGNSEEELEAAISLAVTQSSAIVEDIQKTMPAPQERPRGIPATGASTTGPLENATEQQTLSSADIANMSMDQYAAVRDRLLAATAGRSR